MVTTSNNNIVTNSCRNNNESDNINNSNNNEKKHKDPGERESGDGWSRLLGRVARRLCFALVLRSRTGPRRREARALQDMRKKKLKRNH